VTTTQAVPARATAPTPAVRHRPGLLAALRWEVRKLRGQHRTRAVLAVAALAPILVVVVIHGQSRPPKDTLFGRFATDNGFALTLLVVGFASQWVLPLLTAVVAGDVFASEDQHGTWKTVLTRSTSRSQIFWAKTLSAAAFATLALVVLAVSTTASSWLIVGHQPLTGLSGQTIPAATALSLVAQTWATMLPPLLAFTCLSIVLSIWSRNPAVGIAAPVVLGMVMALVGALGGVESVRPFLVTTSFEAWHGLFTAPRFSGPLVEGVLVSGSWCVVCLAIAFVLLRRRDITGG
jgi:ABC-2 type transport system permease protein